MLVPNWTNDTNSTESFSSDDYMDVEDDSIVQKLLEAGVQLDKFYTPCLCFLGTLGNSMSLIVFCLDSKYRRQSSSYYLSALAVSDSAFLLNLFAVWLENIHGGIITSPLTCPLVMYLGQVACFVSVYLTVGFSLERYIAINLPFSRPRLCTTSKAKKFILGVVSIALLIFSYAWIIAKVVEMPTQTGVGSNYNITVDFPKDHGIKYVCTVPEKYFKISEIANYIDSGVTLIIPFMLITCFNICIAISVTRIVNQRKNMVATRPIIGTTSATRCAAKPDACPKPIYCGKKSRDRPGTEELSQADKDRKKGKSCTEEIRDASAKTVASTQRVNDVCRRQLSETQQPNSSEMRVTKMLLLVSTVFLALNLPLHAIRCTQFIQVTTGNVPNDRREDFLQALQPWANMLFNTNFAVNFLLYCVSGSKFRKALQVIISRICTGKKPTDFSGSRIQRDETFIRRPI